MPFILPPTIALKSYHSYLNYNDYLDTEDFGFLRFNGANVFSSLAKFEVVPAHTGRGLVHIKCFHNKKFLQIKTEGDVYISPEADTPEENQNLWSCTLFRPQESEDGNPNEVRLFHVQRRLWAVPYSDTEDKTYLIISDEMDDGLDIIDLESFVILPNTIALKSSYYGSYLNYSNDSDSQTHGVLKFNGADVFSSLAKFEVVPSHTETGLVHIKCSYTNRFLRIRAEGDIYISAEADKPEEDKTLWSCTLFRPRQDGSPDRVRLFHVQSKQYVTAWEEGGEDKKRLFLRVNEDNQIQDQKIFNTTDLESLVIMPKHVAFKGRTGRYLKLVDKTELRFESSDKATAESWFEVCTDGHGRVQIKSYDSNIYLCYGDEYIFIIDWHGDTSDPVTLFWPVKVDSNTVALKTFVTNQFCALTVDDDGRDAFKVAHTGITAGSRLTLEELILSRKIYNTDVDHNNAVVYDETPVTMATVNTSNNTSSSKNSVEFKFTYTDMKSSTWKASHSWMIGTDVSGSFKIPFIGETGVTVMGEYSGSYEWGESVTTQTTLETTCKVTVPANTSVSVSLIATKGTCDVPYSYCQKDVLYNGKTVVYKKDDGLYTGVSSYKFSYEITSRKEPKSIADMPTTEQKLPDPSVDTSIKQKIPIPLLSGSTTRVQNKVTLTTCSQEQESSLLQLEDAAALP